jgi:hypothetical protein
LHKEYVTQRDTVSLPITSSPNDSRTPPKLLNVASSSTGFHSGSSRKTSTTFSERHRCNIADSPRNAFRRRLKSWNPNITLSKLRRSTESRAENLRCEPSVPLRSWYCAPAEDL